MAWVSCGEADKMGSTPPSSVMAVTSPEFVPCVETIMTASPFCKSASGDGGTRLTICCRSACAPPPGRAFPPAPPGRCSPPPWRAPSGAAPAGAPLGTPFNRAAKPWATCAGNLKTCDLDVTLTSTGFLVTRSVTVSVPAAASIVLMVPDMLRNDPETTSSAAKSPPLALRVPRARSWSPALICARTLGVASSNCTESGA